MRRFRPRLPPLEGRLLPTGGGVETLILHDGFAPSHYAARSRSRAGMTAVGPRTADHNASSIGNLVKESASDEAYRTAAKGAAQPPGYYADRKTFAARLERDAEVKKTLLARIAQQTQ